MLAQNIVLQELDLSSQEVSYGLPLDAAFAKVFAVGISNNRTMLSVNVLFNDISTEQAQALANVLKEHATLKSLCGNKGNETELDMSSSEPLKRLGAEGAIMLAPEIANNRALSFLNVANNNLGELVLPEGWSIEDKGFSFQKYVHIDGRESRRATLDPNQRALSPLPVLSPIWGR
jgi:hypothetical protein